MKKSAIQKVLSQGSHLSFNINEYKIDFKDVFLTKTGLISNNLFFTFEKIKTFSVVK